MDRLVELAEKGDGVQVLVAPVLVGEPFARLSRVVEIEHRGDGIDSQPVRMELLDPEAGVGDEEVADLDATEVEDQRAPVRLLTPAGIGVLVEGGAVEAGERPVVLGEVPRHPVDDHSHAALVEVVDEVAEVVRAAEAGGRRVVAGDLVAPGAVEGVLAHGQQLDMGEAALHAVVGQLDGQLAVTEDVAVGAPAPRAEMHLVDRDGAVEQGLGCPLGEPRLISPLVGAPLHDAGGLRRRLRRPGQRVRLEDPPPIGADDPEFVPGSGSDAGDEELPDPAAPQRAHRLGTGVPPIGVAHQADPSGVGSPDREGDPADPLVFHHPRPQPAPELAMGSLPDEVEVEIAQ